MPTKKAPTKKSPRSVTVENLHEDTITFNAVTATGEEVTLHLGSTLDDTPEGRAAGVPQPKASVPMHVVVALRTTQLFRTFEDQNHIKVSRAA